MADIEGGEVNRISNFLDIKSNRKYGQEYEKVVDKKEFIKDYAQDVEEVAKVLKEIGINVNLAPVLDVEQTLENGVLSKYERAYSINFDVVSELGSVYIKQMQKNSVQTTAKHFPGHGHTDCDTYFEKCKINVSKEYLEQNDLQPFKSAIKKDVSFIMIGLFETPYDQKIAALSQNVITDLLRERLEYKNIVITDDITMGAMKELEKEKIAIETIAAGSDIILTTNPDDVQIIHDSILQAIKEGKISEERIDGSVGRILQMKSKL